MMEQIYSTKIENKTKKITYELGESLRDACINDDTEQLKNILGQNPNIDPTEICINNISSIIIPTKHCRYNYDVSLFEIVSHITLYKQKEIIIMLCKFPNINILKLFDIINSNTIFDSDIIVSELIDIKYFESAAKENNINILYNHKKYKKYNQCINSSLIDNKLFLDETSQKKSLYNYKILWSIIEKQTHDEQIKSLEFIIKNLDSFNSKPYTYEQDAFDSYCKKITYYLNILSIPQILFDEFVKFIFIQLTHLESQKTSKKCLYSCYNIVLKTFQILTDTKQFNPFCIKINTIITKNKLDLKYENNQTKILYRRENNLCENIGRILINNKCDAVYSFGYDIICGHDITYYISQNLLSMLILKGVLIYPRYHSFSNLPSKKRANVHASIIKYRKKRLAKTLITAIMGHNTNYCCGGIIDTIMSFI
jgi:hypothetical protein